MCFEDLRRTYGCWNRAEQDPVPAMFTVIATTESVDVSQFFAVFRVNHESTTPRDWSCCQHTRLLVAPAYYDSHVRVRALASLDTLSHGACQARTPRRVLTSAFCKCSRPFVHHTTGHSFATAGVPVKMRDGNERGLRHVCVAFRCVDDIHV